MTIEDVSVEDYDVDDNTDVKVMKINPNKIKQYTVKTTDDNDISLQEIVEEDKK